MKQDNWLLEISPFDRAHDFLLTFYRQSCTPIQPCHVQELDCTGCIYLFVDLLVYFTQSRKN